MKCQYCNSELNEGALFCDKCGQAQQGFIETNDKVANFWDKEKSLQEQDIIQQLSVLKTKAENTQSSIAYGRRAKSRGFFFHTLLLLSLICVAIFAVSAYCAFTSENEKYFPFIISSVFSIVAIIIISAYATIIHKKGAVGVLIPFIPIYGYYYFLFNCLVGIKHLFAPPNEEREGYDIITPKELRIEKMKLQSMLKEEKNLINELKLLLKYKSNDIPDQVTKNLIVIERKKVNGWQISVFIFTIVIMAVFAVSYHFAPFIYQNM